MNDPATTESYDPKTTTLLSFSDAVPGFLDGSDTPRAYLERCIETVEALEPRIQAFVTLNLDGARAAADASTARYRAGRPLSPLDGMPVGIKDVHETEDMPMQVGSPIFENWSSGWDGACVFALRKAGAAIVGKTVTTEFAFATPGPSRNPWDESRTPGGSSSGSGAAVGARMLPAATGSQVRGSILRPAAYCGAYTLKASYGAINSLGGFPSAPSLVHVGFITGTLADLWIASHAVSRIAGGDPGHPSLGGPATLPRPDKPRRLIRLETAGWAATTDETRVAFEAWLGTLADSGIEIAGRADDPEIEAYERDLVTLREVIALILTYEGRWPLAMYAEREWDRLSERVRDRVVAGRELAPEDYARALEWCIAFRARHDAFAGRADGFVTLNQVDPAPVGMAVGDMVYGEPSSVLGCPALNLPLLAVAGLPLGVQLMGFFRADAQIVAHAHWLVHAVRGIAAPG
ncbi:MAG: amidase [Defluviicoccus sp.]|nr:amidase [Defluviicoccus sp.]MDE0384096.1 amidase [Defluviicoccus sp.]